ncbi:hypothetical protein R6Q57_026460 [Mikania cordata]
MKASFRGSYDADDSDSTGSVVVNAGGINLRASITGDTLINVPSLNGLTISVENPGFFNIDYKVLKKDVRFQFVNRVRVNGKPLNFMYSHSLIENTTSLDGTLLIDSNHKISANYGFKEHDCKVKYTYVHGGVMTIEPRYDFADNSWDLAVSRWLHDDSVVTGSYQFSTRVLAMDYKTKSFANGSLKVTTSYLSIQKKKLFDEMRVPFAYPRPWN